MSSRTSNRGPAAAAGNRRALLAAAKQLFAERGYAVPLNAIAKTAGVGQGVLYRHFPRRIDLAFAVFEENFAELEELATEPRPDALERFFSRLVELTLESLGFVELVVGARGAMDEYDGDRRFRRLAEAALTRAQEAELVRADLTPDDVTLGLQMIYGVAVTARDDARRASVLRVQAILATLWARESRG
ncbi:MAG: TetR/AcrR family transcriptional regulator [Propionibacterium sp.]|nr:TetR/AcrR family transcriptional regulator [Propionibacterium sp.]